MEELLWYIESKMKEMLPYILFYEERNRKENGKSIDDPYLIVHWELLIHINSELFA